MTPLSAWLSLRFGRKKIFIFSIVAFTLTSVLCGLAHSLPQMVAFRFLQGLSGAALIPLSQAILLDINPPERHARAMAIWIIGVTVGPIFAAPLGAWITEHMGWRWVFYINVPIGVLCVIAVSATLAETQTVRKSFDVFGFVTLSIATVSLQLLLDRGQMKDWFDSPEIQLEASCVVLAAYLFAVHSATARDAFINMRIFEDRNYAVSCLLGVIMNVLLLGSFALMPALLQGLLQYPVIMAGLVTGSRGLGTVAASSLLGRFVRHFDARIVMTFGFVLAAIALGYMCRFYLQMHYSLIVWTGLLFGFGTGIASVSISTIAFSTLPAQYRTEGAAVSNLIKNLGGSIGIASTQAFFVRNSYVMHARLAEHVTPYGTNLQGQVDLNSTAGLVAMNGRVAQQAAMMAYNNLFKLMLVLSLVCIPLSFLFRRAAPRPIPAAAVAAE